MPTNASVRAACMGRIFRVTVLRAHGRGETAGPKPDSRIS
jgi:hypothetical protein